MIYDAEDRPRKLATQAKQTVDKVIGDDKYNYLRAKATAFIGKCELVERNQEKAQQLLMQA